MLKQVPQGPQKLNSLKSLNIRNPLTDTRHFHCYNHQKLLTFQIFVGKTVKNVQIDP